MDDEAARAVVSRSTATRLLAPAAWLRRGRSLAWREVRCVALARGSRPLACWLARWSAGAAAAPGVWVIDDGEKIRQDATSTPFERGEQNPVWRPGARRAPLRDAKRERRAPGRRRGGRRRARRCHRWTLEPARGTRRRGARRAASARAAEAAREVGRPIERFVEWFVTVRRASGGRTRGESLGWAVGAAPPPAEWVGPVPDALVPVELAAVARTRCAWRRGSNGIVWIDVNVPARPAARHVPRRDRGARRRAFARRRSPSSWRSSTRALPDARRARAPLLRPRGARAARRAPAPSRSSGSSFTPTASRRCTTRGRPATCVAPARGARRLALRAVRRLSRSGPRSRRRHPLPGRLRRPRRPGRERRSRRLADARRGGEAARAHERLPLRRRRALLEPAGRRRGAPLARRVRATRTSRRVRVGWTCSDDTRRRSPWTSRCSRRATTTLARAAARARARRSGSTTASCPGRGRSCSMRAPSRRGSTGGSGRCSASRAGCTGSRRTGTARHGKTPIDPFRRRRVVSQRPRRLGERRRRLALSGAADRRVRRALARIRRSCCRRFA